MAVSHVEVLVEEPSMEVALSRLLPRLLGDLSFAIYSYQCKDDLLSKLPARLRGYETWLPGDWRIVVVVDRDNDDCHELKRSLDDEAERAGLRTRETGGFAGCQVLNRLAIEELEAWYFGDWQAVRAAYPKVRPNVASRPRYRDPDAIRGGTWEAFERIMQRAGYFRNGLRKIEAARKISEHWDPRRNTSRSFRALCDAMLTMADS